MPPLARLLLWTAVAVLGAVAFGVVALARGETVNAAWLVTAAVCTYLVAYRFYGRVLAARVFALRADRPTPAVRLADGRDYVPTNRWVVFGHHFAAIAGRGRSSGPRSPRSSGGCRGRCGSSSAWRSPGPCRTW
jgi:carbon starvation protein